MDDFDSEPTFVDNISFYAPRSGTVTYEPPINILFVIHIEGKEESPDSIEYLEWRDELFWLKNKFNLFGHKMTVLSNGEYME